jgi:hypothetical protein
MTPNPQFAFATPAPAPRFSVAGFGAPVDVIRLALAAACFAVGFAPITSLAGAIIGVWTLPESTLLFVLPAMTAAIAAGIYFPRIGRLVLTGFAFGVVSVLLYDAFRVPLVFFGAWGDFIPKIGGWLLGTNERNALVGYLWRYIGNGGGMGLAFTAVYSLLRPRIDARAAGVLYGIGVWLCLLGTLFIAPRGAEMLFKLTPLSFAASLIGHLIYGAVLGALVHRMPRRSWSARGQPIFS